MDELDIGMAGDASEVMELAELEARRQGAQEVGPAHLALALAHHRASAAAFRAIGLGEERLRPVLAADRPSSHLPPARELIQLLAQAQARALEQSDEDTDVRAGHLLYALLKSGHPVGQAIREAAGPPAAPDGRTPPQDAVFERVERFALTGEWEAQTSPFWRLLHGAAWFGRWSLFALAWSMVWVFILLFAATWTLGSRFRDEWFWTLIWAGGVGSMFVLAVYGAMAGFREAAAERKRRAAAAEIPARAERATGTDRPVAPL